VKTLDIYFNTPRLKADNEVAQIVGGRVCDTVLRWAQGRAGMLVFESAQDLVDAKERLTDREFSLVRDALKERPWVCLVRRPMLEAMQGLVFQPIPGFDHKGEQIIPVRFVSERQEQGGCPH